MTDGSSRTLEPASPHASVRRLGTDTARHNAHQAAAPIIAPAEPVSRTNGCTCSSHRPIAHERAVLSIVGEGAWAAASHGGCGKRGWKRLHLGVDRRGVIIAQALTDANCR